MTTKYMQWGGVSAKSLQKLLAVLLSSLLVLTACTPGGSVGDIDDNETPLSTSTTEEVAEAEGDNSEEDALYTQTLDNGAVVASDDMDVTDMDISVTAVEEESGEADQDIAPYASEEVPAEDDATASAFSAAPASVEGPVAAPMAAETTVGAFVVSGGTNGTDYKFSGTVLSILTSTPLTIRNASAAATNNYIQINAGVNANITLAGVNIAKSAASPINMVTNSSATASGTKATVGSQILKPTTLHLTLADGTINTLDASGVANWPGLRCGEGSELVIDDSRLNIDSAGNPIVPVNGLIGVDATLLDGTVVKVGDPLHKMDADNPGTLVIKGGTRAAGLGGASYENAGILTIEGGNITSTGTASADSVANAGAGIGGGLNGGCTEAYFNGGIVTATGAFHASGIGAGYGNQTYASGGSCPSDGIAHGKNTISGTIGGDIYINGGFIKSTGGSHGNAFGQGCVSSNTNHVIKVTGGTLLPTSPSGKDIGGANGYTIITGGSVRVASADKFQGLGNTAYNTEGITTWQDITDKGGSLPDSDKVEMVTIDLSADINPDGKSDGNNRIDYWELLVGNVPYNYGAPAQFDNGKLYLWLPKSATSQQITVNLKYRGNDNKTMEVEPLFREPNTPSGTLLKRYVDFKLDESYVEQLVKEYDGLPFDTYTIDADHPLETPEIIGGTDENPIHRTLTNSDAVTYKYQRYDERDGIAIGTEVSTGKDMPSDTGIMKFTMTSSEYSNTTGFKESYWGHRATGWCEITPVPAVLTLKSAEWGNLNLADGSWKPTTTADDEVGNRIRVEFSIRSAIGTKPTCKTPTGAVQLTIDGKPFGSPIQLTKEAVEQSKWSSYTEIKGATTAAENTEAAIQSAENRWTAEIVYYMDPTQADGLLTPKPSKKITTVSKSDLAAAQSVSDVFYAVADNVVRALSDGQAFADEVNEEELGENEYKLSAEYLPDKNYIEGVEANPQNADATATIIIPVNTPVDITDDQGTKYEFEEVDEGDEGGEGGEGGTPTPGIGSGTTMTASIVKNYSDFHKKDAAGNETIAKDYFTLQVNSQSAMPMTWTSSDPAVADVMRDEAGNVIYDKDGNPRIQVNSCGAVTITMHQNGNAIFNEQTRIIEMTVIPDASLKPDTEVRVVWENKTHPGLPAAPGDEIEYTIVGSNLTEGSSWQDVNLGDLLPPNVKLDPNSIEVAKNFPSPEDLANMTPEDLADLPFVKDGTAKVVTDKDGNTTLQTNVGSVYGGQSTALKFTVTVDEGLADRDTMTGDNPPTIPNTPTASGSYGVKETQDLVPGVSAGDGTPIPVDDTKIYGIDPDADPEALVIPKDPVIGGNDSDIYVEKTAENLTREGGITLPGDTVRYTITVGNRAADSCLYWPVIRDTLPVGVEPVPGSFVLTRVDGAQVPVADNVYVKATRTVALYVDDLYGGESTTLTFECTVGDNASTVANVANVMGTTPSEKYKKEHPPADDPDAGDEDPDGNDPDGGDKDPDGTNPGGEGDGPDGNDPAGGNGEGDDDPDGTNPGGNGGGTGSDDPDYPWPPVPGQPWTPDPGIPTEDYPWDDFNWEDYIEENGIPEVSNPEPVAPGTLIPSTDPKLFADKDGEADLVITKTAENLTNDNGNTYVTDRARYTINLADTKEGTVWFNAVVRDTLPRGVEIDMATAKLVTAQGAEVAVAADAYNPMTRILAVNVGDVPGGKAAVLTFEADIVDEAVGSDIGNTARAYGTLPSEVDPEDLLDANRPAPGSAFNPVAGWDAFDQQNPSIVTAEAAYPSAHAKDGVRPASESPHYNGGDGWGTELARKYLRLAQTGDPLVLTMTGLVVVALSAAVVLLVLSRRHRKHEADMMAR